MDKSTERAIALLKQGIAGTKEVELVIAYIKQLEARIEELEQQDVDMTYEAKNER